ncbi:MAG: hypothetical protein IPH20_02860 [Bacteroidales bacterium]|nr:hypothetical protein [Bacteroidales bacterium]
MSENDLTIVKQVPAAPALEVSFPNVVPDRKISVFDKEAWTFTGNWKTFRRAGWQGEKPRDQSMVAEQAGDVVEIGFTGTGISINGNWIRDGGKADVYLDGKIVRTIDTYYFYNNQEHDNVTIWHVTGLADGRHTVKLVVKGEKKPESSGTKIYITRAITYKTAPKKSESIKFTFEKSNS